MDNYHIRKPNRLENYDYSSNGCYFVTVCTRDKAHLLCHAQNKNKRVGAGLCTRPDDVFVLSSIGCEVEKAIKFINIKYNNTATVDCYCIMPNHIHLLITLSSDNADGCRAPSLRDIMRNFKSYTTSKYRENETGILRQRGYYDHIIRNDEDYAEKHQYIINNPIKWLDDEYYPNKPHERQGEIL